MDDGDRLSTGTQTISIGEVASCDCRCGAPLNWQWKDVRSHDLDSIADCACGMEYVVIAVAATIEGIDRNAL